MWVSENWQDYELIDCSNGEKLERWGEYTLVRPDPQAIWKTPRQRQALELQRRALRAQPLRRRGLGQGTPCPQAGR